MTRTTLSLTGLVLTTLIAFPSLAAEKAAPSTEVKGTLLPSQEAVSVSFIPEDLADIVLVEIIPHGTTVKKGDLVAKADLRKLDQSIADYERYAGTLEIALRRAEMDWNQFIVSSLNQKEEADRSLKRVKENFQEFLDVNKARMLAEEEEKVARAERALKYKEEELKQLNKMYSDGQVAEETEEIILTRVQNDLEALKFALEGVKQAAKSFRETKIVRTEEDWNNTVRKHVQNLEQTEKRLKIEEEEKKQALEAAKTALEKARKKLADMKTDRESCEFRSPEDGIFVYGGYLGDKWDTSSTQLKLRPGGKLAPYDKLGTIASEKDKYVVVTNWPEKTALPAAGSQVDLTIKDKKTKGVVKEARQVPNTDGRHTVVIEPEISSDIQFIPGLPVTVVLAEN